MLHLTLTEGDYVMIGETIKVHYDHNNGSTSVSVGIEAPRDMPIIRSTVYEDSIAQMAADGDTNAIETLKQLVKEDKLRREKFNKRKTTAQMV